MVKIKGLITVSLTLYLVFLLLIVIPQGFSVMITPTKYTATYTQPFSSNFKIVNDQGEVLHIKIEPPEDLKDYITIKPNDFDILPEQQVVVMYGLSLPKNVLKSLGKRHKIELKINVLSKSESSGTFTTTTTISYPIEIIIPKKGKHINVSCYVKQTQDKVIFTTYVHNIGKEDLDQVNVEVKIKDPNGLEIAKKSSSSIQIKSGDIKPINVEWSNPIQGVYDADIIVNYDKNKVVINKKITIGKNFVVLTRLKVTKFYSIIGIKNKYNYLIKDTYAVVEFYDETNSLIKSFRSGNFNINPKEKKIIKVDYSTGLAKDPKYIKITIAQKNNALPLFIKRFEITKRFPLAKVLVICGILIVVILIIKILINVFKKEKVRQVKTKRKRTIKRRKR